MKTFFVILFPCFLIAGIFSAGGQDFRTARDLRSDWQVLQEGKFVPFEDRDISTDVIYFRVSVKELGKSFLRVHSSETANIFINNNLAASGTSFRFLIDSLGKEFSSNNLLVAIYQKGISKGKVVTEIQESKSTAFEDFLVKRSDSSFRDFAISTILLLVIFALIIVRQNPKLAYDYLAIGRIFSSREIEDAQTYARIGSSTNILFYVYSSMLLSYFLIITFHFLTDVYPVASVFSGQSYLSILTGWLKLSLVVLVLQFIKIILVFGISYLFGISEVAGVHFFNWVRMLLVVLSALITVLFLYVIWHGQSIEVHSTFLKLLAWVLVVWMILLFLKLAGKLGASMFHLFSYICATELIPFLFIIKVLYN